MQLVYTLAILPDSYNPTQALELHDHLSGANIKVESVVIPDCCQSIDQATSLAKHIKSSIDRLTDPSKTPRTCTAGFEDCFCMMNQPLIGRCKHSPTN